MNPILVVDDDRATLHLTTVSLENSGYEVTAVSSAVAAFEELAANTPDLVILDVVMPTISGLDVLEVLRERYPSVRVIMLTALRSEENMLRGLRLGADDYVSKPFSPRELVARVESLLRRSGIAPPTEVSEHGGMRLDAAAREVRVNGRLVELTAKEFDLLHFLVMRPGRVFTRGQLLAEVWSSSSAWQQEATVTEHVRRLRTKIEADPNRPQRLVTVRGVGYRFDRG